MMEKMMQTPNSRPANSRNSFHCDEKYCLVYEVFYLSVEVYSASFIEYIEFLICFGFMILNPIQ